MVFNFKKIVGVLATALLTGTAAQTASADAMNFNSGGQYASFWKSGNETYRFSSQSSLGDSVSGVFDGMFGFKPIGRFAAVHGVSSAVPAPGGTLSLGVTWANPRRAGNPFGGNGDFDTSATVTIGNPVKYVSVSAGVVVTGTNPFFTDGYFTFSASRFVFATSQFATFVGGTVTNVGGWGIPAGQPLKWSVYATTVGDVFFGDTAIPYEVTVGYGSRFPQNATGGLGNDLFWGAGVGVAPGVALSVSGTTKYLNAGAAIAVPGVEGLAISAGVNDVTNAVNNRQFTVSIGIGRQLVKGVF